MSLMVRVTKTAFVHAAGGCLVAALVLGACGDAESGIAGPQREQAQKADAICTEAQDAVGRTLGDEPEKEQMALQSAAQKLHALNPPSEDETIWQQFVGEMDNLWLSMLDQAQSLDPMVNDRARAQRALDRAKETNGDIMRLAGEYGAVECAKGFGR